MTAAERIEKAKARLLLSHGFYGIFLLMRDVTERELPFHAPMGVDQAFNIYFDPKGIDTYPDDDELLYILAHEVMHMVMDNIKTAQDLNLDPKLSNRASDAVNNAILDEEGVGKSPDRRTIWPGAIDKTMMEVYREMEKQDKGKNKGEGGGKGKGKEFDAHLEEGERSEAEITKLKTDIAAAHQLAKQLGNAHANSRLGQLIDKLLEVNTPWHEILSKHLTAYVKADTTWSKPNRRLLSLKLIMPGTSTQPSMGKVTVIDDVSGSVSPAEQRVFLSHLHAITELCNPKETRLIFWDTEKCSEYKFDLDNPLDPLQVKVPQGGGTNMATALQYVEKEHEDSDVVILLTDGETPWVNKYDLPLYVVCTTRAVAPVGETIYAELK